MNLNFIFFFLLKVLNREAKVIITNLKIKIAEEKQSQEFKFKHRWNTKLFHWINKLKWFNK